MTTPTTATVLKYDSTSKQWHTIHSGTITGETTTMYRVSGNTPHPCDEWFAKRSNVIKCNTAQD